MVLGPPPRGLGRGGPVPRPSPPSPADVDMLEDVSPLLSRPLSSGLSQQKEDFVDLGVKLFPPVFFGRDEVGVEDFFSDGAEVGVENSSVFFGRRYYLKQTTHSPYANAISDGIFPHTPEVFGAVVDQDDSLLHSVRSWPCELNVRLPEHSGVLKLLLDVRDPADGSIKHAHELIIPIQKIAENVRANRQNFLTLWLGVADADDSVGAGGDVDPETAFHKAICSALKLTQPKVRCNKVKRFPYGGSTNHAGIMEGWKEEWEGGGVRWGEEGERGGVLA